MPGIIRKLLVCAAVEGLLVIPQKQHPKGSAPLTIEYATGRIYPTPGGVKKDWASIEAYGIVGLLNVASKAYLITITGRKKVAQIKGRGIYVVSGVCIIPVTSQAEAVSAIGLAKKTPKPASADSSIAEHDNSGTSEEEGFDSGSVTAEEDDVSVELSEDQKASATSTPSGEDPPSVAQDVFGRKGKYGRFAERWFSKKGWAADKRRVSVSISDKKAPSTPAVEPPSLARDARTDSVTLSLLPKLLRTTKMMLSSGGFYFAYDFDLTRGLESDQKLDSDLPLNRRVDETFFWNHSLSRPLAEQGHHSYILPLMQGFVGQRAFSIEKNADGLADSVAEVKEDVGEVIELQESADSREARGETAKADDKTQRDWLLTLISRRSVLRPGLRYLRRGVDEDGHVANAVETEQILSEPSWSVTSATYSFAQVRGSIPVFFSQSPYSFKPVPVPHHSYEVNHSAFAKHFSGLRRRYGSVQVAMLVEKSGAEGKIGDIFQEHTQALNSELGLEPPVGFEWFDFHKMCAGMKFENVSILMDTLKDTLSAQGCTVLRGGRVATRQSGVLRTNCMDCLDRTNVVQSAVGARALQAQLAAEGITLDTQADPGALRWFNGLWADNGDAVSKQYSSTAALKGDFTRTRRRDYRGALNDFGLTLSRYYNNVVNDYFAQAAIDFLLGAVTDAVFEEFEASLKTADPGVSVERARQAAIDTAAKIVIADAAEELTGGWTTLAPVQADALRTAAGFEEVVLLVTAAAIYPVRFDWDTEKVASFERIGLASVARVRRGTYVTSALSAVQLDPDRNVGLVVWYRPAAPQNLVRVNTRSMSTAGAEADPATDAAPLPLPPGASGGEDKLRLAAFKALPARSSVRRGAGGVQLSEQQVVADICAHIEAAAAAMGEPREEGQGPLVEEGDIIGVAEAKKSTGLLETWGHSIKKLVWA